MKPRHAVLGVALALAACLVYFDGGAATGDDAVVEPSPRSTVHAVTRARPEPGAPVAAQVLLAPAPRADLFPADDDALFGSRDFTPPPPAQVAPAAQPPTAPAPPFAYFGKMLGEGRWEVYLQRGAESLVVREGSVIDDTWRIERISPPLMKMTYLPLNQQQQLDIGSD